MAFKIKKKRERQIVGAFTPVGSGRGVCDRCGMTDWLEVDLMAETPEALCGECEMHSLKQSNPDAHSTKASG